MTKSRFESRQNGVALVTVMVILLLSIIAVLAAGRTGLLNEALVGSDSDYNRALAAAEALLRDAEIDVQGRAPVTGFFCRGAPGIETELPGIVGCRDTNVPGNPWFPATDDAEWDDNIKPILDAAPAATPCIQAICAPANMTTLIGFEDNPTTMAAMALRGARYAEHTRVTTDLTVGNPILAASGALPSTQPSQGWYWVEVFRFDMGAPFPPELDKLRPSGAKFIFRITAIALGQKAGTRAVLRSFYVPNPFRFGG